MAAAAGAIGLTDAGAVAAAVGAVFGRLYLADRQSTSNIASPCTKSLQLVLSHIEATRLVGTDL